MNIYIYIILSISFIYCESSKTLLRFYDIPQLSYNNSYLGKDALKSGIVPGWGQYSSGDYKKAFIFLCMESIAFGVYYYYNKKGIKKENLTKQFGDKHWSFSTWVNDYYDFSPSGEHGIYSYIFEGEATGPYKEIWEGGHKLQFSYDNDSYMTTSGDDFKEFYNETLCQGVSLDPENYYCDVDILNSITVAKDHHYYENTGKYDHFFAGWDDNDQIIEHIKESGELIAMSPNKKQYRTEWEKAAEYNRFSDYALYAIYTNHILSILDILVFSKINKNSKFNYKLRTIYNPNNNLGIGGIQLLVSR